MNFYPSIYMEGGRSMYQQGGAPAGGNPQQEIYQMLQQRGILGDMSFEQFSQMPPQQIRQLMEQAQQAQAPAGPQPGMEQGQPQGMEQPLPQAAMGHRIPMPLDQNQVQHLTMDNHGFQDQMAYGGRGYRQYGGPIEPLDAGAEADYMGGEPELEPIYGEDGEKNNIGGTATQVGGALAGVGSGILKGQKNSKKSAGSTENVVGDIGGGALEGASAGAAFGPWGMLAGAAIGGTMGAVGNSQAKQAEQDMLNDTSKATQVGGLGSSLARYGKRTHERMMRRRDKIALGERMEVERFRNMSGPRSKSMKAGGGIRNAGGKSIDPFFNDTKKNPYYNSYYPYS